MISRARASRSFRSIIILFANASATHSSLLGLNFRVRLNYTQFVRALSVAASSDGRWLRLYCFVVSLTRRVSHKPISNMPIVHTSSFAPGNYAICGAIRNNTPRLGHITLELPLPILIVLATRFSRQFNTAEASRSPKRFVFHNWSVQGARADRN